RIGSVINPQDEVWDQFGKQAARGARQLGAPLGQPEMALEVPPEAKGDQQVVQHLERREFVFVDDLIVAEHLLRAFARPPSAISEVLWHGSRNRSVRYVPGADQAVKIWQR